MFITIVKNIVKQIKFLVIVLKSMTSVTSSVARKKMQSRNSKEGKHKQYPLLNLYILVVAIVEIVGELAGIFLLRLLKPVPMILMIIYISGKNSQRDHLVPTLIRAGLILSLIGDIFLMVNQISAFMIGTLFFFVAHILYCIAFTIGTPVRSSSFLNKLIRTLVSILFIGMCIGNIYTLWSVMPNRALFSSYGIVLCLMNILAVKRYNITTPYSYGFIVAGAILFGLSDNLLAMLKFNSISTNFGRGMVMLLYYSGQYLLMHGAMHHSNLQHQISKFIKTTGSNVIPTLSINKQSSKYNPRQWDHGTGDEFTLINEKNRVQ